MVRGEVRGEIGSDTLGRAKKEDETRGVLPTGQQGVGAGPCNSRRGNPWEELDQIATNSGTAHRATWHFKDTAFQA
jgi:hypothetical protein